MNKKSKSDKKSKSMLDSDTKHSGVNGQPKIGKSEYEGEIFKLQVELVKLQDWVNHKIEPLVREVQPKVVAIEASGVLDMEFLSSLAACPGLIHGFGAFLPKLQRMPGSAVSARARCVTATVRGWTPWARRWRSSDLKDLKQNPERAKS